MFLYTFPLQNDGDKLQYINKPDNNLTRKNVEFVCSSCIIGDTVRKLAWQLFYWGLRYIIWEYFENVGWRISGTRFQKRNFHKLDSMRWFSHRRRTGGRHNCITYTVSKNVPHLTCYNLDIHGSITIIFGARVTEKVGNQNVLYLPPHLTCASAPPGEKETRKLCLFT